MSPDAVCHNMVAAGLLKAGLWEKALSTVQDGLGSSKNAWFAVWFPLNGVKA